MTNTPCQSKSGIAGIAARSGLALSCRRNRGLLLIIVQYWSSELGGHRFDDWAADENFMRTQYDALGMPSRIIHLHPRKHTVLPYGINQLGPQWENSFSPMWPVFTTHPGDEFVDPRLTGRHSWWNFRWIGVTMLDSDQLLTGYMGETQRAQPMVAVDETREPYREWHNTDPAESDSQALYNGQPVRGRRGLSLYQDEFEREVVAFRDEHGHLPELMMVMSNEAWKNQYPQGDARFSSAALGLHNLPDQLDIGESFYDATQVPSTMITHLTHRTALGDALRNIRDRYGVRSELNEYGIYPSFTGAGQTGWISGRMFREIGLRFMRARAIVNGRLPGSPTWFAVPWPPGGTP